MKRLLRIKKQTLPNPSLMREGLIVNKTLYFLYSQDVNRKLFINISPSLFKRRVRMSSIL
jgi:hypothetical protein